MAEARLDHLDPGARRVLRAASVFGVAFTRGGVAAVLGDADTTELGRELAELSRGELIERHDVPDTTFAMGPPSPRSEGSPRSSARPSFAPPPLPPEPPLDESFAFRHAIVRDAAYAMLTEGDRTVGHALAGTWLEQSGEDDALLLAEHLERGGKPARALRWYRRAAEQALEGSDLEGTVTCAERAVACGAEGDERGALRILQAEAHAWRDEPAEAVRCCAEAMSLLPRGGAPWCEAAGIAVVAHVQVGDLDRFASLARELHAVDPHHEALDRYVIGSAIVISYLWSGGLYDVARSFLRRTEAVAARAEAPDPLVAGWLGWARCCRLRYEGGDPWRHLELAEESAASLRAAGDARGAIRLQMELGIARRDLGHWADAERLFREACDASQRLGIHTLSASAKGHLASVLLQRGRLEDARLLALDAIDTSARSRNLIRAGATRAILAQILARQGDLDGALREARTAVDALGTPPARAAGLSILAAVLLARGDAAGARRHADEAAAILRALATLPENEALLRLTHAEALAATGDLAEARDTLRAARARLLDRARGIADPLVRQTFFEEVEANRRTLELAEAMCR